MRRGEASYYKSEIINCLRIYTMLKNRLFILTAMLVSTISSAASRNFEVVSPDGTLKASIVVADEITYSISKNGDDVLAPSEISMKLSDGTSFDGARTSSPFLEIE